VFFLFDFTSCINAQLTYTFCSNVAAVNEALNEVLMEEEDFEGLKVFFWFP